MAGSFPHNFVSLEDRGGREDDRADNGLEEPVTPRPVVVSQAETTPLPVDATDALPSVDRDKAGFFDRAAASPKTRLAALIFAVSAAAATATGAMSTGKAYSESPVSAVRPEAVVVPKPSFLDVSINLDNKTFGFAGYYHRNLVFRVVSRDNPEEKYDIPANIDEKNHFSAAWKFQNPLKVGYDYTALDAASMQPIPEGEDSLMFHPRGFRSAFPGTQKLHQ